MGGCTLYIVSEDGRELKALYPLTALWRALFKYNLYKNIFKVGENPLAIYVVAFGEDYREVSGMIDLG